MMEVQLHTSASEKQRPAGQVAGQCEEDAARASYQLLAPETRKERFMSASHFTTNTPRTKETGNRQFTDWIGDLYRLFETADGTRTSCLARLKGAERQVLLCLAWHWGRDPELPNYGNCWPSKRRIAAETGLDRRTVQIAIGRLEALGFIFIDTQFKDGNERFVFHAGDIWGGGHRPPPPAITDHPPGRSEITPPAITDHPPRAVADHPPGDQRSPEVEVEVEVFEVEAEEGTEVAELQYIFSEKQGNGLNGNGAPDPVPDGLEAGSQASVQESSPSPPVAEPPSPPRPQRERLMKFQYKIPAQRWNTIARDVNSRDGTESKEMQAFVWANKLETEYGIQPH